jgi:hypothetical protein
LRRHLVAVAEPSQPRPGHGVTRLATGTLHRLEHNDLVLYRAEHLRPSLLCHDVLSFADESSHHTGVPCTEQL